MSFPEGWIEHGPGIFRKWFGDHWKFADHPAEAERHDDEAARAAVGADEARKAQAADLRAQADALDPPAPAKAAKAAPAADEPKPTTTKATPPKKARKPRAKGK